MTNEIQAEVILATPWSALTTPSPRPSFFWVNTNWTASPPEPPLIKIWLCWFYYYFISPNNYQMRNIFLMLILGEWIIKACLYYLLYGNNSFSNCLFSTLYCVRNWGRLCQYSIYLQTFLKWSSIDNIIFQSKYKFAHHVSQFWVRVQVLKFLIWLRVRKKWKRRLTLVRRYFWKQMFLKEKSSNTSCRIKIINLEYKEHHLNQTWSLLLEGDVLTITEGENLLPIGLFPLGPSRTTSRSADYTGQVPEKRSTHHVACYFQTQIPLGFLFPSLNNAKSTPTAWVTTYLLS